MTAAHDQERGVSPTENYNKNKIDKDIGCNLFNIILRPTERAKL